MIAARQEWPADFAERYRRAGYWTGETLGEMLRARATATPDAIAVVGGDVRWTYRELDARADRLAAGFLALGIRPRERVVVQLPNIPEFLSVVFGLFRAGIVPVFALPAHRSAEITQFASAAEAVAYVIPAIHDGFDYRTLAPTVRAACPTLRHVITNEAAVITSDATVNAGQTHPVITSPSSSVITSEARDLLFTPLSSLDLATSLAPAEPFPSDVAFMQLSGGSTGLSKLIPRTHDDYLYSVRESARICGLSEQTVYLATLPIAHNYPMSSPGFLGVFYAGGTVVLSPSPAPDVAFPLIARERVTITGVVPPVALVWLDAAPSSTHDLSSLEVLQVGGAKLTPEVARRVTPTLGCKLQQVFGMAEGLVNYTRLDDPDDVTIYTQGRPISEADEIRIVDDAGNDVAVGASGHLLTRGPYTIRAYHNAPDANARAFTPDGFYRTGDIVSRTPTGYLVVQGRATDQINRGGEKVSPEEIEDHLLAHPSVHDAVVVSIPDQFLGERSCAYIVPRGDAPKPPVLKAWIRGRGIAAFKIPDQIIFVDAFPSTGVGKISRKELRAALRATSPGVR